MLGLDYENLIQVNQAEVAEQVGMNRHHVNRSIKKLIELGVVLEGVKSALAALTGLILTFMERLSQRPQAGLA